jgi:anti-sigma B factor antagonist
MQEFTHVVTPSGTLLITLPSQVVRENSQALKMLVVDALAQGLRYVHLDCRACCYLDSTGLGVLLSVRKKIRSVQGELALLGLNDDLRFLFDLTKLTSLFAIEPLVGGSTP